MPVIALDVIAAVVGVTLMVMEFVQSVAQRIGKRRGRYMPSNIPPMQMSRLSS